MEVKHRFKKSTIFGICLIFSIIACQKKIKEQVKVIDDENSQFAGKSCYGSSIQNEFLLKWSDGSHSLLKGTKDDLNNFIKKQQESNKKRLVIVEQNRKFDFKMALKLQPEQTQSEIIPLGSFWEVWGQEDLQANELWDKNIKGAGVTIAVVDGGIDQTHPSLMNRIYINENEIPNNGIDDDNNGFIDDYKGFDFSSKTSQGEISDHGTHVAGIIAAEPKESPMLGIAPQSKILPLSIFGGEFGGSLETAVAALEYAKNRGIKIVNASWGGAACAELLRDAIISLAEKDILFINASGNNGVDIQFYPEYPAAFNLENQITVGANMQSGLMAAFSNYGYQQVHVLAPGHQILSTVPGGWDIGSGTSMAAPFVSGLAALLWSAHPESTSVQIKKAILQSVKDPQNYNPVLSMGRVNAVLALEKLELILKELPK